MQLHNYLIQKTVKYTFSFFTNKTSLEQISYSMSI